MRRLLILCALLVCSVSAHAEKGPGAVRKQVESALRVTGTIDISPAGDVVTHALDQQDKLPKGIVDMAARILPQWTFEPVLLQSNAVSRSKMNLLFVGKTLDDGRYSVELRSASFDSGNPDESVAIDRTRRKLPAYPQGLLDAQISGTVFVIVKIGRDGKVIDAQASHVNLRVIGSESEMANWRNAFARNSIAAIKHWTFIAPKSGPEAERAYWLGTMPIDYFIANRPLPIYGEWQTYVAGPKAVIPWQNEALVADGNTDALTPNSFHAAGSGRRLLTPLAGG